MNRQISLIIKVFISITALSFVASCTAKKRKPVNLKCPTNQEFKDGACAAKSGSGDLTGETNETEEERTARLAREKRQEEYREELQKENDEKEAKESTENDKPPVEGETPPSTGNSNTGSSTPPTSSTPNRPATSSNISVILKLASIKGSEDGNIVVMAKFNDNSKVSNIKYSYEKQEIKKAIILKSGLNNTPESLVHFTLSFKYDGKNCIIKNSPLEAKYLSKTTTVDASCN